MRTANPERPIRIWRVVGGVVLGVLAVRGLLATSLDPRAGPGLHALPAAPLLGLLIVAGIWIVRTGLATVHGSEGPSGPAARQPPGTRS